MPRLCKQCNNKKVVQYQGYFVACRGCQKKLHKEQTSKATERTINENTKNRYK